MRKPKKRDAVLVRGDSNGVIAEMRALSRETGVPASTLWVWAATVYLNRRLLAKKEAKP